MLSKTFLGILAVLCSTALAKATTPAAPTDADILSKMDGCANAYGKLKASLFDPIQEVYRDVEHQTQWIYHKRLATMFQGMDPNTVHSLFTEIGESDFNDVFHAAMSGYVRNSDGTPLNEMQTRFLIDLHDFVIDSQGVFWKSKEKEQLLVAIREELNAIDRRNTGEAVRLEDIGDHTENAMVKAEEAVLTRGVHDTSFGKKGELRPKYTPMYKWGISWDPVIRFIWSVYPRVAKVIDFMAQIRVRMQHAFQIDRVVIDAGLQRADDLHFNNDELVRLKYLLANTGTQIADARKDIQDLFGHELSATNPLKPNDIHYYRLAKNADNYEAGKEYVRDQIAGESDLDRMREVIDSARERKKLPKSTPEDFVDNELRFRHMQYDREAGTTQRRHHAALSRDTSVNFTVNYSWTVLYTETITETKTRTVSDGNGGTKTETYTESRTGAIWTESFNDSVTRVPSYRHVLTNSYDTSPGPTHAPYRSGPSGGSVSGMVMSSGTTSTPGLDQIIHDTQPLRLRETPYWNFLQQKQDELYAMIENHADLFKIEKEKDRDAAFSERKQALLAKKEELKLQLGNFTPYTQWRSNQVQKQWHNDVFRDFQLRNDTLVARYENLIKFYDIYEEQVNRREKYTPQLRIEYRAPNYTEPLAIMKKRMERDNWIKLIGGLTTLVGGGGGIWYSQQPASSTGNEPDPIFDDRDERRDEAVPEIPWKEEDFGLRDKELEELRNN